MDRSDQQSPPVILLTGPPGVGKSTVIQQVVQRLGARAGGFYTREVRQTGARTGFELVTLAGETGVLATSLPEPAFTSAVPFGKYRVNLAAIDTLAVPALCEAAARGQMVVVDEIGPMEMLSELFCRTVLDLLAGQVVVVGAIVQRAHSFADRVKRSGRVELVPVSLANRTELPVRLLGRLSAWLRPEAAG